MIETVDRIAIRALFVGLILMAVSAVGLVGQQLPDRLSLDEAIRLAKANNPNFLSTVNDQAAANWQVREAYGQFIPSVRTSLFGTWQEAGSQRFGTIVFEGQSTDWLFSGYNVSFGLTLDGNSIFGVPQARANKRATEARISAAEFNLESVVALQYMAVLRAMEAVAVAQRQLDRARQNFDIVETRVETGAAAGTEGKQAEVDLGRAEVALIQAQRDLRQTRLLLQEQVGVPIGENVRLVSGFEVFEPAFEIDQLMQYAMEEHPTLRSFRAQESASRAAARQTATSQYLPSLSLSASLRGQAQEALNESFVLSQAQGIANSRVSNCEFQNTLNDGLNGGLPGYTNQDCTQFAFGPADEAAILSQNAAFPFQFEEVPMTVSLSVSLPIFTGFSRERQVSELNNQAEDAEHARRAEELRLRTMVTNTYDNLTSAYRVVQAEQRNRTLAEEQLQLQQRRYALGAADLLLLMDAQTSVSTAERDYLNALYDFHYNLIALEAAVGRPLRVR
ncbi:MAG: TolC family protein [Gemmatimonadota bacterium]|nr:TolC family protein [Gemmatimonadota bacterium]